MSQNISILSAETISEAFKEAVTFLEDWTISAGPSSCWFRGINDNKLKLQPGAYWRPKYEERGPLVTLAQEGIAYTDKILGAYSWDTYYFAQHHSIPTRLLDWTESFSAALFFALDAWEEEKTVPCIWIIQPSLINEVFIGWEGILGPEYEEQYKIWLQDCIVGTHKVETQGDYTYDNDWPLAIYPKKANARLVVQQGNFTIHGRRTEPLDELFIAKGGNVAKAFARIDLPIRDKQEALRHLQILGVRRSAIYPDIDNFVRRIREEYNW